MRVALLPGDGVGPEVLTQARRVVDALELELTWTELDWGSEHWHRTGAMMPPDALDVLRGQDAILMGAVGDPSVPDTEALWGLILKIRQELDLAVNVRPARLLAGIPCPLAGRGPDQIDMVFVRENTEGEYAGVGGGVHPGQPNEVVVESSVFTRSGCERVVGYAFELAARRKGVPTSATKSNASRYAFPFWDEIVEQVGREYPQVRIDRVLVDALCARLITTPVGRRRCRVEPVRRHPHRPGGRAAGRDGHGRERQHRPGRQRARRCSSRCTVAPDIARQGVANPCGAIWSTALMLEHLGQRPAAVAGHARAGVGLPRRTRTPRDIGGAARTTEVGDAVVAALGRFADATADDPPDRTVLV